MNDLKHGIRPIDANAQIMRNPDEVTHWMPLPQPPKGDA